MEYTSIIIMLALGQYMYFLGKTGAARGKYGIKAPACTGDENFERIFRVQQNTLEQLIIFIPAQFAFAWYVSPVWGAVVGIIYIVGRFVYAYAYIKSPARRGPGMLMTFISNGVLVLGAVTGTLIHLI